MSLINDALKKAKQAQTRSPGRDSAPQLRPPAADHPSRSAPTLIFPAIIVAVGLLGAALVWVALRNSGDVRQSGPATATPVLSFEPEAAAAPKPGPVVSLPSKPEPVAQASVTPSTPPATASPQPEPSVIAKESTATPQTAKPAPPKLDGIFFHPSKPTAIVNNKLVSPGSRVGDLTVLAITQTSVTLSGGGQTNVLSLSE